MLRLHAASDRMSNECGTSGGMKIGRRNCNIQRNHTPVPLYPPQIPHDSTWDWAHVASVESLWLTAWAVAQPLHSNDVYTFLSLIVTSLNINRENVDQWGMWIWKHCLYMKLSHSYIESLWYRICGCKSVIWKLELACCWKVMAPVFFYPIMGIDIWMKQRWVLFLNSVLWFYSVTF
jgi:hypothetical protein